MPALRKTRGPRPEAATSVTVQATRVPRSVIAVFCTLLQVCLGTVYAWSFFQTMLVRDVGWTFSQTAAAFSITIFTLGVSAALAGQALPKVGPQIPRRSGQLPFLGGLPGREPGLVPGLRSGSSTSATA